MSSAASLTASVTVEARSSSVRFETRPKWAVPQHLLDLRRHAPLVERVEQRILETDDLRQTRRVRGDDCPAALHRLQGGKAKSFVQAREDRGRAQIVQENEVLVRHVTGKHQPAVRYVV